MEKDGSASSSGVPIASASAAIGLELANLVSTQQQVLDTVKELGHFSPAHLAILEESLERTHQIAIRSQQLSRLAGGSLRQSHEKLELHTILDDILKSRRASWRGSGVQVQRYLRPVEVIVDPGLLFGLLEAAVDWAMEQGQVLIVNLEMQTWPEHGILSFNSTQGVRVQGEQNTGHLDTLSWHLLIETAKPLGVTVKRVESHDGVQLTIEFPRTVKQLQGVTAVEMDVAINGNLSTTFNHTQPLAGGRVLLVTSDPKIQRQVDDVCDLMGLRLDCVPDSIKATRFCEMAPPQAILVDERARDLGFEQLRKDLLRQNPRFPMVEISPDPNLLAISDGQVGSMSAVSVGDVRSRLPSILLMEMERH
jgi:hypothetical protein